MFFKHVLEISFRKIFADRETKYIVTYFIIVIFFFKEIVITIAWEMCYSYMNEWDNIQNSKRIPLLIKLMSLKSCELWIVSTVNYHCDRNVLISKFRKLGKTWWNDRINWRKDLKIVKTSNVHFLESERAGKKNRILKTVNDLNFYHVSFSLTYALSLISLF